MNAQGIVEQVPVARNRMQGVAQGALVGQQDPQHADIVLAAQLRHFQPNGRRIALQGGVLEQGAGQ